MKNIKQIGIIILVLVVFLSAGVSAIILGVRSTHIHYVCVEVNPRVEFLTDKKHKVTSLMPLNQEAKELLIQEKFVELKIEDAVEKFLTLCARGGYLKVSGEDNAVKLSVLSGLNQGLETDLTRLVNKFFVKNEILGVVIDSSQDLKNFKSAKKMHVSAEKYDLMLAVNENGGEDMSALKKLSNKKLIEKIQQQHENYNFSYTTSELENKVKLIDFNRVTYQEHLNNITPATTRKFREKLQKFVKENQKKYKVDFDREYNNWLLG